MNVRYGIILILLVLMTAPAHGGSVDGRLYPILEEYVRDFRTQFRRIPEDRRYRLDEIVRYLAACMKRGKACRLFFIDSDQSALAVLSQAWARTAAFYFRQQGIEMYSGGIRANAIEPEAIFALERAGFIAYRSVIQGNGSYKIKYSYNLEPIVVFPKEIDYRKNPRSDFMAVVIDSNADLNLERVRGTYHRLSLLYQDPTGYRGSQGAQDAFDQTCRQIALEMFYVFWRLKDME